ncbi:MAG: PAS domain-containing sensor histidine kinase, partial [Desulfosarcina sp.]
MNKKIRLLYKLYPSYLLITLLSLVAISWYALSFTRQFYLERTQIDLEDSGRLLEKQVLDLLSPLDEEAVDALCKDAGEKTAIRVSVILPDGRVIGDSEEMPANMDNHQDREEIQASYNGNVGVSIRYSDTIEQKMMYVAFPMYSGDTLLGVIRTSLGVTAIDERIGAIRWRIAAGALLVALLASGISWFVSRRITHPLEKMR